MISSMRVVRLGDNVNTDDIIAGRYLRAASTDTWRDHLFEDYDARLRSRLSSDSVLLAGANFGCGSSREQAVLGLKAAGVRVILAVTFGAIFQRNCVNNGVLAATYELDAGPLPEDGVPVSINWAESTLEAEGVPLIRWHLPPLQREICLAGGLLAFYRARRFSDGASRPDAA